jgi:hypothetical protein
VGEGFEPQGLMKSSAAIPQSSASQTNPVCKYNNQPQAKIHSACRLCNSCLDARENS